MTKSLCDQWYEAGQLDEEHAMLSEILNANGFTVEQISNVFFNMIRIIFVVAEGKNVSDFKQRITFEFSNRDETINRAIDIRKQARENSERK